MLRGKEIGWVRTGAAELCGVDDDGAEPPFAPTVPDGFGPSCKYPYSPCARFPHKSSGYPGHGTLQSVVSVVTPGT
jgi:hypothetical protein